MAEINWEVKPELVRTDYIRIQNLKQWLVGEVPYVHPDHPRYIKFWSRETKKCIEGVWGKDWGKFRFMPGNLYYFGNYGIIEHTFETEDGVTTTEDIKPKIVDYLWDFAYMSIVAYGFSGFTGDDKKTCDIRVKLFKDGFYDRSKLDRWCLKPDGSIKEYEDPYSYISRTHDKPMGKALFRNPTQNVMIMGSRGGTKSYWVAIAELEYNYMFGGARRYNQKYINNEIRCQQCVGSSEAGKSSELLKKFIDSRDAKINYENENFRKWFGIWKETTVNGEEMVTPSPFYRRSLGTLDCPNKKPSQIFRAKYKVEINGEWKEKGSGSQIAHVNYSSKKPNGERAAEGGRYLFSDVEEVGSMDNFIPVLGANEGTIARGGRRFGIQWAQGTSGNIEYVQAAKKVFLNPEDYNILAFANQFGGAYGGSKKIGYFIPYYATILEAKDENGNTKYKEAFAITNKQREKEAASSDPKVLRDFVMNKPCFIEEMWYTGKGNYLPANEASIREKQLLFNDTYKHLMRPVELIWDSTKPNGVRAETLHDADPYVEFPHEPSKKKDPSGCIVIYEEPTPINGAIPNDMYIFSLDPYVEEDIDAGGSIAAAYVLINPKYISYGARGNCIAATYIGKPKDGLDVYYENLEKLMAFYGNPIHGLWFEKNRGETCREHFIKKGKAQLLALTPQLAQGSSSMLKRVTSYGYVVGNLHSKKSLLKRMRDWMLETTELQDGVKINIERIPCLYTIRQIAQYDIDGNYDAVDGLRGCILGLAEIQAFDEISNKKEQAVNHFDALLKNRRIFKRSKIHSYKSSQRNIVNTTS